MHYKITKFFLIITFIFAIPAHADDTKHFDDTVAAGIIFKLSYLLGGEGTWSDMNDQTPKRFQGAMTLISKDSLLFSNTERGQKLKKQGNDLITFISKSYLFTMTPTDKLDPKLDADKFFKDLGFEPGLVDPIRFAQLITDRIDAYAKLSNTPSWVRTGNKENKSQ
jgi:hypothetical protein